jgi:hypothetical protein
MKCTSDSGQCSTHEGCLQSLWTHLITPNRNLVEVWWQSCFRITSLGKQCTSYNTPWLGAPFSWLEKPRNRMGQIMNWILCLSWKKWIGGTPLEHSPYSLDLTPCDFWAFPTMKRELQGKKFWSDHHICSTFLRSGWSIVRSKLLAKGVTSKKRPSLHLHKVPTWSNKWVHELYKQSLYIVTHL